MVNPTRAMPTSAAIPIIVFSGRPIIFTMMSRLLSAKTADVKASTPGTPVRMAAANCSGLSPARGWVRK